VVLKESQEYVDPFVFSSVRFLIAAAVFSPFMRRAMRDERTVKAGVEIGAWAAGGERRGRAGAGCRVDAPVGLEGHTPLGRHI